MNKLVEVLRYQRARRIDGSVYKACQCDFTYSSNHIEGSTLTHDQTVQIFDCQTFTGTAKVDDIVETRNHFEAFDRILDTYDGPLSADYLCELHGVLKAGTSDAADPIMAAGHFKRARNVIGGALSDTETAEPTDVPALVGKLIDGYEAQASHGFKDIVAFHWQLERIHPFSDGTAASGASSCSRSACERASRRSSSPTTSDSSTCAACASSSASQATCSTPAGTPRTASASATSPWPTSSGS